MERKELLPNISQPRGAGFATRAKADADQAADVITRRSRTEFIVYANCTPIFLCGKKQNSVESSSFSLEFIAMKACCKHLRSCKYSLQMMATPCEDPSHAYGDNQLFFASLPCQTRL